MRQIYNSNKYGNWMKLFIFIKLNRWLKKASVPLSFWDPLLKKFSMHKNNNLKNNILSNIYVISYMKIFKFKILFFSYC